MGSRLPGTDAALRRCGTISRFSTVLLINYYHVINRPSHLQHAVAASTFTVAMSAVVSPVCLPVGSVPEEDFRLDAGCPSTVGPPDTGN